MSHSTLDLALLWHFHQPCYRDPEGQLQLPWVRLHAVRGYTDMLDVLEHTPAVRVTLNLVPILLEQLESYVLGEQDADEVIMRRPPETWSLDEARLLWTRYGDSVARTMTNGLPRLTALMRRRAHWDQVGDVDVDAKLRAEWVDFLMQCHLAWSGSRLTRAKEVQTWRAMKRPARHDDLCALLDRHREEAATLIPRLRALADAGQVELCTTPYHHPILPLVGAMDSRDFPQAGGEDDPFRHAWPDDARDHVRRAVERFEVTFGRAPSGMWPAEGAVSEDAATWFGEAGLAWIASDEAVLRRSDESSPSPPLAPRQVETAAGSLRVLFRDHDLSDRIGFVYSGMKAKEAASDFVERLEALADGEADGGRRVLLVALDGENPWEHYTDAGRPFLDALYQALAQHDRVRTVTCAEAASGEARALEHLATGSWIDGTLETWAGHPEKLGAWRWLARLRSHLGVALDQLEPDVAESVRILQASDWTWWLGDDHPSPGREAFDGLFLAHAHHVARRSGWRGALPSGLRGADAWSRPPREWIEPTADAGARAWDGAGFQPVTAFGGSMSVGSRPVTGLEYGFESDDAGRACRFHLRLLGPAVDAAWWTVDELDVEGKVVAEGSKQRAAGGVALGPAAQHVAVRVGWEGPVPGMWPAKTAWLIDVPGAGGRVAYWWV